MSGIRDVYFYKSVKTLQQFLEGKGWACDMWTAVNKQLVDGGG